MLLLFSVRAVEGPDHLFGKKLFFGLLCVPFLKVYQSVCGIWDSIVLISDHCLSIYYDVISLIIRGSMAYSVFHAPLEL